MPKRLLIPIGKVSRGEQRRSLSFLDLLDVQPGFELIHISFEESRQPQPDSEEADVAESMLTLTQCHGATLDNRNIYIITKKG